MTLKVLHQDTINAINGYFKSSNDQEKAKKVEAAQNEVLDLVNQLLKNKSLTLSEFSSTSVSLDRTVKWIQKELECEKIASESSVSWTNKDGKSERVCIFSLLSKDMPDEKTKIVRREES